MNQKKYQVFVSSTYEDLQEERGVVMKVLLEMDCIPSGMELFPAANEDQWSVIKAIIDNCDYFIAIIAGRYGSLDNDGTSFTEKEYCYAIEANKPVISFIHEDPGSIPSKNTEPTDLGKKKLEKFRQLVRQKTCKHWKDPNQLGMAVASSLGKLRETHPAAGWIRGDLVQQNNADKILQLRSENENLRRKLSEIQNEPSIKMEELARGEDIVEIRTIAVYREFVIEESEIKTIRLTWNEIFYTVSPLMIQEANESEIAKVLSDKLSPNFPSSKKSKGGSKYDFMLESDSLKLQTVTISQEIFHTIIVQLLNLGLIKESVRKRSVRDADKYWTLTKSGKNVMNGLRVIRRSS